MFLEEGRLFAFAHNYKFKFFVDSKKLKGKDILVITNYTKPKSDKFFFSDGIFDLQNNKFVAKNTKILLHKNLFDEERLVGTTTEEKELERKNFLGGAAIVASHINALGAKCNLVSVIGEDAMAKYAKEELKELFLY